MTQTAFRNAAGGTAYDAVRDTNASIIEFLQFAYSTPNLVSLSAFLQSESVDFRARAEERPVVGDLGTCCYVATTIERMEDSNAKHLQWRCTSRLTIRSSQGTGFDACAKVLAVSGAITSMLNQTIWHDDGIDWRGFYQNAFIDRDVCKVKADAPVIDVDEEGKQTGRAKVVLYATWFHGENT